MAVDASQDLILVTCASGKQGTDLVPVLRKHFKRIRLQVRSDASKDRLQKQYPELEVVQADLFDASVYPRLLDGVTACYLVSPPLTKYETRIGTGFIDAAVDAHRAGSLKHFVYSSVLHPILRKILQHDAKRYVEEYLVESGLPYTTLQPSHVMENFPLQKVLSEDEPVYPIPYNANTVFTWTSLKDLAEVTTKVFLEREKHFYATYQLVSTQPGSYHDAVKQIGSVIGKTIRLEEVSLFKASKMMADKFAQGAPDVEERAKRMLLYYDERGLVANTNVMRMLLGREPQDLKQWAAIKVKEIEAQAEH